jgi:ABC-2 type transport system permease protein
MLQRGQTMLASFGAFSLPPGFIIWAILFFALGYILYASLMGAIGALSPNAREAGQYTFIVMLPLLLPLWLNFAFINDSNGRLATAMSLFPLTAPTSMMTRIAAGYVPIWQIILSLVGLALTTYVLVLFSARFFRADTLLSTSSFHWKRLFTEFRRPREG